MINLPDAGFKQAISDIDFQKAVQWAYEIQGVSAVIIGARFGVGPDRVRQWSKGLNLPNADLRPVITAFLKTKIDESNRV